MNDKMVTITDIIWDCSDTTDLPKEVSIEVATDIALDETLLCEFVEDYLSNEYGYCVDGYFIDIEL